ncbi:hypothetical protein [Stomatohabitans albus]
MTTRFHSTPRVRHSNGYVRLNNDQNSHRIDLDAVGTLQIEWQESVHYLGGAIERNHPIFSNVSPKVISLTKLELVATPRVGSIILDIQAKSNPMEEAYPDGKCFLEGQPEPLVDQAVTWLHTIINQGGKQSPEGFTDAIGAAGPKLAQSLDRIAEILDDQELTLTSKWMQPGVQPVDARINKTKAKWIRTTLQGTSQPERREVFTGTLHTISTTNKWKIKVDAEQATSLPKGGLVDMTLHESLDQVKGNFRLNERVRLEATLSSRKRPDGETKTTYTITSIKPD